MGAEFDDTLSALALAFMATLAFAIFAVLFGVVIYAVAKNLWALPALVVLSIVFASSYKYFKEH